MNEQITISNLQIIITIGVALAAFVSPVVVALINNRHLSKEKKEEFRHIERLKELECENSLMLKRIDVSFQEKTKTFERLINCLSSFSDGHISDRTKTEAISLLYKSAMFCEDRKVQNSVFSVIYYINKSDSIRSEMFKSQMESLIYALRQEMYGTTKNEDI